jgi:hypothetical protein
MKSRVLILNALLLAMAFPAAAQSPPSPENSSSPATQPQVPPAQDRPPAATSLTRRQAEALALKNNPQITVSKLRALQAGQFVREQRSALRRRRT